MKIFFIFFFLSLVFFETGYRKVYAQDKINETFEGDMFPPDGWSILNIQGGNGQWRSTNRIPRTGNKCAVSDFSPDGGNNFLVSKRFIPVEGDSLIFHFRQTFWRMYKDTFNIYVSTTDSLSFPVSSRIFHSRDSMNYPQPLKYERYALSMNAYSGQTVWLGFQHVNYDGDNIRLDDISVGQPGFSEVGVISNISPMGIINICTYDYMIPTAAIKNYGTLDQNTPFNVTYTITGPVNYSSTVQETISAGSSITVNFDTVLVNIIGTYNVKIYTSVPGDQNPNNDTLISSFSIINANFGGGLSIDGNYFFANSMECSMSPPAQPEFCWKDTSGSTNLILNNLDVSGGLLTGNLNDGYFSLGNILPNGRKIVFYNSNYDSVFIATNGILGLRRNNVLLFSDPGQIGYMMSQPVPAFSPLWMDLDFGNENVGGKRLSYKVAGNQLIITYDRAAMRYGGESDYVSFQISIELGNLQSSNSRLLVQYDYSSTGEGFKAKYANNTLPPHLVGMKNILGNNYLLYRYKDSTGVTSYGPLFDSSMALEIGTDNARLNNKCSGLNASVFLEAIHPIQDTITISVRDSEPPYSILESVKIETKATGSLNCLLTIPADNHKYYIVLNHRNSIETWSRTGGELFESYNLEYDFTIDSCMAYSCNMLMNNGKAYIYCGDIDQDKIIDGYDLLAMFNAVSTFKTGYISEDLNHDNVVNLDDLLYSFNNTLKFISLKAPE